MNPVARGVLAGAAGTTALNLVTNLDMVVRGRPASDLPAVTAHKLVASVGVELGDDDTGDNRAQALGAVLGFVAGIGTAALYAFTFRALRSMPSWVRMAAVALTAMVAGSLPSTLLGTTDPRKWGTKGWIADVVPHALYGAVTVMTHDRLASTGRGRRLGG